VPCDVTLVTRVKAATHQRFQWSTCDVQLVEVAQTSHPGCQCALVVLTPTWGPRWGAPSLDPRSPRKHIFLKTGMFCVGSPGTSRYHAVVQSVCLPAVHYCLDGGSLDDMQCCAGQAAPLHHPCGDTAAQGHLPVHHWLIDARGNLQQHICGTAIAAGMQPATLQPVRMSARRRLHIHAHRVQHHVSPVRVCDGVGW
jgi:hypothetical protein